MKAVLKFDLNDMDSNMEFNRCINATKMASLLFEFAYNTRKSLENEVEYKNLSNYEALDLVYEKFFDLLKENNIIIDDLII